MQGVIAEVALCLPIAPLVGYTPLGVELVEGDGDVVLRAVRLVPGDGHLDTGELLLGQASPVGQGPLRGRRGVGEGRLWWKNRWL